MNLTYQNPADRLHDAARKIDAINLMLFASVEQGADLRPIADGLNTLLDEQTALIAAAADDVESALAAGSRAGMEREAEQIAATLRSAIDASAELDPDPKGMRFKIVRTTYDALEGGTVAAFELAGLDGMLARETLRQAARLRVPAFSRADLAEIDAELDGQHGRGAQEGERRAREEAKGPALIERALDVERHAREEAELSALARQSARHGAELAGHAPDMTPDELRANIIGSYCGRGFSPDQLAPAINMKAAAVARILERLNGRAGQEGPDDRGKAVNE